MLDLCVGEAQIRFDRVGASMTGSESARSGLVDPSTSAHWRPNGGKIEATSKHFDFDFVFSRCLFEVQDSASISRS